MNKRHPFAERGAILVATIRLHAHSTEIRGGAFARPPADLPAHNPEPATFAGTRAQAVQPRDCPWQCPGTPLRPCRRAGDAPTRAPGWPPRARGAVGRTGCAPEQWRPDGRDTAD